MKRGVRQFAYHMNGSYSNIVRTLIYEGEDGAWHNAGVVVDNQVLADNILMWLRAGYDIWPEDEPPEGELTHAAG